MVTSECGRSSMGWPNLVVLNQLHEEIETCLNTELVSTPRKTLSNKRSYYLSAPLVKTEFGAFRRSLVYKTMYTINP